VQALLALRGKIREKWHGRKPSRRCGPLPHFWPKKETFEPPSVWADELIKLRIESSEIEIPTSADGLGDETSKVYTRAFGTEWIKPNVPGPTIRVRPGQTIKIDLENLLREPDPDCNRGENVSDSSYCYPNTTNLHTHGLHVSPHPGQDDIFEFVNPRPTAKKPLKMRIKVPDFHEPGTYWYHPHHHHSTALQAGGGALGALIVEDPEGSLPPQVAHMPEVVLVLTYVDAKFTGSISEQSMSTSWQTNSEFSGILVNGQFHPEGNGIVAGMWTRARMIFASINKVLEIYPTGDAKCDFELLAKDGIYLNTAPRKIDTVYLGPGNRADVAVRCTCPKGQKTCTAYLVTDRPDNSTAYNPYAGVMGPKGTGGQFTNQTTLSQYLMKVTVHNRWWFTKPQPDLKKFKVARPCYLVDLQKADKYSKVEKHTIGLQGGANPGGWLVSMDGNGKTFVMNENGTVPPPMGTMELGTLQEWHVGPQGALSPSGVQGHPFHLHVSPYQLQDMPKDGHYFQSGDWQDTFIYGNGKTEVTVRFQASTFTGRWVAHCHFLQHEDMGMMNYVQVTGKEGTVWKPALKIDPKCYHNAKSRRHSTWSWVK